MDDATGVLFAYTHLLTHRLQSHAVKETQAKKPSRTTVEQLHAIGKPGQVSSCVDISNRGILLGRERRVLPLFVKLLVTNLPFAQAGAMPNGCHAEVRCNGAPVLNLVDVCVEEIVPKILSDLRGARLVWQHVATNLVNPFEELLLERQLRPCFAILQPPQQFVVWLHGPVSAPVLENRQVIPEPILSVSPKGDGQVHEVKNVESQIVNQNWLWLITR